jgi:NADPH2:quinone reductase
MKALLCNAWCGPEDLVVEETRPPEVGAGEVLIDVRRAGLNFPDLLMISGQYQVKPPLPFSPGMECSGVVAAVGRGVTQVGPGDRVMASTGHGSLAEQVVAEERSVFRLPDGVSFDQAAGFPVTYGTAYHALRDRGQLQPGEVLLVNGAAGGVGLNAVELGKQMGATVIGAVGSDAKMPIVEQYGADFVFNYAECRIRDAVKGFTDDLGPDVIFDPVGGDAFDESLRCIRWNGRLLVIGFASGRIPEARANLILLKSCQIVGVYWGAWTAREPEACRAQFATLLGWTAEGRLRPHVSRHFPLERVAEGLHAIAAREVTGKVVIDVRP